MDPRFILVASTDDYLLEKGLKEAVADAAAALPGVEVEDMGDNTSPAAVALELCSPSLFASERLLLVPEARDWLDTTVPARSNAPRSKKREDGEDNERLDLDSLLETLSDGAPDGMALVLAAWCGRKPKGALVDLAEKVGRFRWLPAPPPPKPWEDVALSREQTTALNRIVDEALDGAPIDPQARNFLLQRLGFQPRQLAQEVNKLATAAAGRSIDVNLVRSLVMPKERSIEVVRESLLKAEFTPLFDLLTASSSGHPIIDYSGRTMDAFGVVPIVFATVSNLLQQFLFLHHLAAATGTTDEMEPANTRNGRTFSNRFKTKIAPKLEKRMKKDMPFPKSKTGKNPTQWTLGNLFAAAGRYREETLVEAVVAAGDVEAGLRGGLGMAYEHLTAWLCRLAAGSR